MPAESLARTVIVQARIHHHPLHQRHFLRPRNLLRAGERTRRHHLFRSRNRIPARNRSRLPPRFSAWSGPPPSAPPTSTGSRQRSAFYFGEEHQNSPPFLAPPPLTKPARNLQTNYSNDARMLFPPGPDYQRQRHQTHRHGRFRARPRRSRNRLPASRRRLPETSPRIRRVLPQLFIAHRQRRPSRRPIAARLRLVARQHDSGHGHQSLSRQRASSPATALPEKVSAPDSRGFSAAIPCGRRWRSTPKEILPARARPSNSSANISAKTEKSRTKLRRAQISSTGSRTIPTLMLPPTPPRSTSSP